MGTGCVPERQEEEADDGEDHLDVRVGREARRAEHAKLQQLAHGEQVHLALRHLPDVVRRRVRLLQIQS